MRLSILTLTFPAAMAAAMLTFKPSATVSAADSAAFTRHQVAWAQQVLAQPPPLVTEGSLADYAWLEEFNADSDFMRRLEGYVASNRGRGEARIFNLQDLWAAAHPERSSSYDPNGYYKGLRAQILTSSVIHPH